MSAIGVYAAGVRTPNIRPAGPAGVHQCVVPRSNNSYTITRTMHYFRQHDCVVGAVVEEISTFKFCLIKIQEICPLECFIFTSKCPATKMRLVPGLHSDPLGELTALPQTPWMD